MPYNFTAIEKKWQAYWLEHRSFATIEPQDASGMSKAYILDMFPYPSGAGLHVGHPEGYTATDIVSRYLRMKGFNVLHPMGWDAFGLPAEQYAVKTGRHPRETTEENIANFRKQIQMLGLSYDWDREVDTTDPSYYRWTQWIFLQLFNSYFDPTDNRAKPIAHLIQELQNDNFQVALDGTIHLNPQQEGMEALSGSVSVLRRWNELSPEDQADIIAGQRMAYMDEAPVNWCPGLGTVLANEEVIDGKSEVGGFPVERRPMRQWMLRITAYADRLTDDLAELDWPESLKEMQRNWIGRSVGAEIDFVIRQTPSNEQEGRGGDVATMGNEREAGEADGDVVTVFTTRPDTLYGATYMVLAPEHPLVDRITTKNRIEAVLAYRATATGKSERDRQADAKDKTGVFTGAFAVNPINDEAIPVWISDYVLMGYGTGAIMAVPGHDERDFEFATKFGLPIRQVVASAADHVGELKKAFVGEGIAVNSDIINGKTTRQAKEGITLFLHAEGQAKATVKYKLRDWLFSRQRYWGEPFPLVLDAGGHASAIAESELPLLLPEVDDFKPTGTPEPPLTKAREWVRYSDTLTRETNTMPQWAGSSWYYLRYIDPHNTERFVDPDKEHYWMPVDLYVGGVEHAVLHLLYARFWHKVLFDLGHVSTPEPFKRLVNQGLILGEMEYHTVEDPPRKVSEEEIEKQGNLFVLKADPSVKIHAEMYKMSKARGNVVNPDDIVRDYGADAFRLYEMYMGPLEASKPWSTRDIVGMSRFLNAIWRNLIGEEDENAATPKQTTRVIDEPMSESLDRQMHRTIKKVGEDIESLRFNTGIAELIKLNNELTHLPGIPRELAENLTLLLAPFAPHIAEEIWHRLGHPASLARAEWPAYDASKFVESMIELPVQVNGKLRDRISVPAYADEATVFAVAESAEKVKPWIEGKTIKMRKYVTGRLVNLVVE